MVVDGRAASEFEGNENEIVEEHAVRYLSLAQTSSASSSSGKIQSLSQQASFQSNNTNVI
jgi:hypothetical protein